VQRWPDGIDGEEWFQQDLATHAPDFVHFIRVGERHNHKKRLVAENVETLQWLANLAALTIHQWSSHANGHPSADPPRRAAPEHVEGRDIERDLARPDYFVMDLDPGDGPWAHLIEVARAVRALLDALELESFVKTTGKRGLHVVVPIARGPSHDQATGFAEQIARAVAKVLPKIATVERMKEKRGGRLYVDYGQNGEGRTIAAPYTLRALDGAPVSTPLAWDEVTEALDPRSFTLRTVLPRFEKRGDLFAGALKGRALLPSAR
jgi:bifunctional non-homologous end joining protein LigD